MKNIIFILLLISSSVFGQGPFGITYNDGKGSTYGVAIIATNGTPMRLDDNLAGLANTATARTNIGLGNVTNESKATMFTNPVFTGVPSLGTLTYSPANALMTFQSSVNGFNQFIIQNSSNGNTASSGYVVNNDQSTDATNYGEFGMNSSGFTGTPVLSQPGYVYLTSTTRDLAIGTTTSNAIHFTVNNGNSDVATISSSGIFSTANPPDFTTGLKIGGAASSGKILIGNGTNFVPSTPTYPTSAGTSGHIITSDGTNFSTSANNGGWTTLRVSGSNATTTGQTLVDITGLVSGTLSNSTMYEVEIVLSVTTSTGTNGTTYGIATGGSGGASVVNVILTGTTTTTAAASQTINTAGTKSTAMLTTASISGTIIIKGYVTTRGSGTATISVQHSKETSGTSTVLIGSVLRYRLAQ